MLIFVGCLFMAIQSVNPATGKVLKVFKATSSEDVEKSLYKAKVAFAVWGKLRVEERVRYVEQIVGFLEKRKTELGKLITLEMGRVYADSLAEIDKSISICKFYVENGEKFLQEQHVPTEASKSYVEYTPLGIILGIMPWNYPVTQVFRALVPAIVAGNVFVLKHASNVPQCAMAIEELFREAGFPEGVVTNLFIEGKDVGTIIADDRIAAVTLTGGEAAGSKVAELAGKHLKKSVLELGGSDAFIVLEDADIDAAVASALKGRLTNAGQACNSPKRIILSYSIAGQFKSRFVEESKKMKVGDPMDPETNVGPMAGKEMVDLLEGQVHNTIKKGAKLLQGGKRIKGQGFFYEVTVVDEVKKGMPLFDEEVFGPVVVFTTVQSDEEAIEVANDSHLGLSASIWTKDVKRAHHFIDNLHVGLVFVNQVVRSDPRLPYGGVKKSGYGRELGEHGIREFTNIKTVVIK